MWRAVRGRRGQEGSRLRHAAEGANRLEPDEEGGEGGDDRADRGHDDPLQLERHRAVDLEELAEEEEEEGDDGHHRGREGAGEEHREGGGAAQVRPDLEDARQDHFVAVDVAGEARDDTTDGRGGEEGHRLQ